jgi:hypothetical protein
MAIQKLCRQDNRWSAESDQQLTSLFNGGHACDWIAERLNRSIEATALRLYQLKVIDSGRYIKLTKDLVSVDRQTQVKVTVHYDPIEIGNNTAYLGLKETIMNWSAHSCVDNDAPAEGFFTGCGSPRTVAEVNEAIWLASVNNYQWAHFLHVWLVGSAPVNLQNLAWCAVRYYCDVVKAQVEWFAVIHAENHLHILLLSSYATYKELFFGEEEVLLFKEVVYDFLDKAILASPDTDKAAPWIWGE